MKHYVDSSVVLAALLEKSPVLNAPSGEPA